MFGPSLAMQRSPEKPQRVREEAGGGEAFVRRLPPPSSRMTRDTVELFLFPFHKARHSGPIFKPQ